MERSKVLKILSGRNRPDLEPVYPQYDLMMENTSAEPEIARPSGIFEPYRAPVAQQYPE